MRKKFNKKILIIFLLTLISIGFAYLSATLNLNGTVGFNANTFDVHFDNVEIVSEDVTYTTLEVDSQDNTKVNASISFKEPSEIFEYTVDIVNAGGIDAKFDSISSNLTSANEDYITIDVKYLDGTTITQNDVLRMGQSVKIRVKVIYNYDIDELPSISSTNITTTVSYKNVNVREITYDRKVWNFDYTGFEQVFIVPKTGTYKLEVWGAQGGNTQNSTRIGTGGYGGYSTGTMQLTKGTTYYVIVGGQGSHGLGEIFTTGGYNGGGKSMGINSAYVDAGSGGGATHIALDGGLLSTFSSKVNKLIIVAGGGGGSMGYYSYWADGGSGGGYIGCDASQVEYTGDYGWEGTSTGGTQSSGGLGYASTVNPAGENGSFGQGGNATTIRTSGGGGGYYGGGSSSRQGSGGGSGYIGYSDLTNGIMYCYNCQESVNEADESGIKTRSTTNVSETPTSNYAKIGNGYARITLIN